MSRLDELIEKLCPDGVEYKNFGEIATIFRGASPRPIKNFITSDENGVNWIKIGDVSQGSKYVTHANEKITEDGAKKSRRVKPGDFILSNSMSFGRPYILQIEGCVHDGWLIISDYLESFSADFLYYLLNSTSIQQEMAKRASFGGAVQNLNADIVKALVLPVPPLPVQEEIVRILDNFTGFVAELQEKLQAELQARTKQYEYYRELILDKNKDAEWVSLLDISDTFTGLTYKPSDVASEGTLVLRSSNIQNSRMSYEDNVYVQMDKIPERAIVKENDILICVRNGSKALIGKAAIVPPHTEKMAFGAFMTILRAKKNIDYRYLFFVWQSPRIQNMIHGESGMPINQITKKMLEQIKVPLPSLENQKEIIAVLEKFDKLSFDISKGLTAEIEARQKQYEYYRDKLLTFKELKE